MWNTGLRNNIVMYLYLMQVVMVVTHMHEQARTAHCMINTSKHKITDSSSFCHQNQLTCHECGAFLGPTGAVYY